MAQGGKRTRGNMMLPEANKRGMYTQEELNQVLTDQLPDIYAVFRAYNEEYFDGLIGGFEVRWCARLWIQAGKTTTFPLKRITISTKLLIGREIRIMVETLLHEMIHAYLFCNDHPHPLQHGEDFVKVMTETNILSTLNIGILDEGGLDHIAHLQVIWECSKCKEQIVRFKRKSRQLNDKTARLHRVRCRGTWRMVG